MAQNKSEPWQARALAQQKNATNLMTVVAADAVGKFPDAYVGDALRRLVGVVVEEDQGEATGVTIRIAPDYINITTNGIRRPDRPSYHECTNDHFAGTRRSHRDLFTFPHRARG